MGSPHDFMQDPQKPSVAEIAFRPLVPIFQKQGSGLRVQDELRVISPAAMAVLLHQGVKLFAGFPTMIVPNQWTWMINTCCAILGCPGLKIHVLTTLEL